MALEFSRRGMLCSLASAAVATVARSGAPAAAPAATRAMAHDAAFRPGLRDGRTADPRFNGFDPATLVRDFDHGRTHRLASGRVVREWELEATERVIELAPGVRYTAWTYNDRVPGPTLRAREGELLRIRFANRSGHPHSIHFHGLHPASADGVPGSGASILAPGGSTTYEFEAAPFGLHLYHCHAFPLAEHIARGLYGAFLIDPAEDRPEADELVMVMNAFDLDSDGENEVYAVNTIPFAYAAAPIAIRRDELVRIHLVNVVEYDPVNSFHLHANLFEHFPTGTSLRPSELTDTVLQCQGQRGILELRFPFAGDYMFHAHQSEFTELGWMGAFAVA